MRLRDRRALSFVGSALFGVSVIVVLTLAGSPTHSGLSVSPATAADKDCGDFSTQAEAQKFFIKHGGPSSDPHRLDADHDGIACESNPCPCSTATGGGGGGGGGNGDKSPEPTIKKKLCGKFRGIGGSRVCLKVVVKKGKLKKVKGFKFRGLPAKCSDDTKIRIAGKNRRIKGHGHRFRTRKPHIVGKFTHIRGTISGKVKSNAKKARGTVRVNFTNRRGVGCTTRAHKWKAS